jgi:uridine kinase
MNPRGDFLQDYHEIISEILSQLEMRRRFILGIDGLSRSGKTTLTKTIKQELYDRNIEVCVFHLDDYIVERNRRYDTGKEEWYEYYNLQWDVLWLRNNLFGGLRTRNYLSLPKYHDESDRHSVQDVKIPEKCVLMVEGVFLQRKEWRDFFDLVIYLDCSRDVRFSRESEVTQNKIEKFINRYWKAEDYYLSIEDPRKRADKVFQSD